MGSSMAAVIVSLLAGIGISQGQAQARPLLSSSSSASDDVISNNSSPFSSSSSSPSKSIESAAAAASDEPPVSSSSDDFVGRNSSSLSPNPNVLVKAAAIEDNSNVSKQLMSELRPMLNVFPCSNNGSFARGSVGSLLFCALKNGSDNSMHVAYKATQALKLKMT